MCRFFLLTLLLLVPGCATNTAAPDAPPSPPTEASNASPAASPIAPPTPLPIPPPRLVSPTTDPDPVINAQVQQYVDRLAAQGFAAANQGVWVQTSDDLLANHQGTVPLPAASLTKVATSLAALKTLGPNYRFVTALGAMGTIENGILKGDLVVQGSEDPFFVWEEAIAVGNVLNQIGIRQVTGRLIIVGKFYMNYEFDAAKSGALLKQALNARAWSADAEAQYQTLPAGTARPQVAIAGPVALLSTVPSPMQPLVRHESPVLVELLKKMNRYSNNAMAEMIATRVGGARAVAQQAAAATGVPATEIQLVNGSGLSEENRISPRAVVVMLQAIAQILQPQNLTVGDVLTVIGTDTGILDERNLPNRAVVKSGSLNAASALAGVVPTEKQAIVWFAMINGGENLIGFRSEQEALLQTLMNQWGTVRSLPAELQPQLAAPRKLSRSQAANSGDRAN